MYVGMYACMHVYTYVYICRHIRTFTYTHIYIYMYACKSLCTFSIPYGFETPGTEAGPGPSSPFGGSSRGHKTFSSALSTGPDEGFTTPAPELIFG